MPTALPSIRFRRVAAELALWITVGLVMGVLGPFGSSERTLFERLVYWQYCMVGGGLIGVSIDAGVRRIIEQFWLRAMSVGVLMTPPVMLLVWTANHTFAGTRLSLNALVQPWFEVFVVCLVTMLLRQLIWSRPIMAQPTATPDIDPTEAFRLRLSAKRRAATLIAVQAEDHYLRVHTDAGEELVTSRFGDALKELAQAPGFRTHRSWWVAADAIDQVKWLRGRGEARLKCGLVAPISRSQAAPLKAAGWF